MKKLLIHVRIWVKFLILTAIGAFLMIGAVAFFYKPIYAVTLNGEEVGYTANKTELQSQINEYIEKGKADNDNIAFAQIQTLPEYKLCLLKKDIVTNDEYVMDLVKDSGTTYYRYYAILEDGQEKLYVSKIETAEEIVNTLKEKESTNIDKISIIEKYETELKDFVETEAAVDTLFVEPEPEPVIVVAKQTTAKTTSSGTVNTSLNTSNSKVSLGISLAKPISGTITSRFGAKSSIRKSAHTGLDIAASKGTAIGAAAAGKVSFAGWKGSYGNLVVVDHGNGVQTYYAHCSSINVSVGESVSQGEKIAAVGSTGNSTGPHLHLEVRVNGVAYNPQNYLY